MLPWVVGVQKKGCAVLNHFSRVRLFGTIWTVACQATLSMGFSRQEYWSGLSFPSPGDLPNPGIKLHWQVASLPLGLPGKPQGKGNQPEIFYCCSLLSSLQDGGAAGTAQGAPISSMLDTPLTQLATFPRPAQGPPRSTSPPQQAGHLHSQGLHVTLTHGVWGTPSPRLPWSYFRRIYSKQEDCLTKTWPSCSCFD